MSAVTIEPIDVKQSTQEQKKTNVYDRVPYQSHPYELTKPSHLHTIGTLFGMKPPRIDTARVLELGGAAGNNIIPHAINYPKAEFLNVDYSSIQINEGKQVVKQLGLKNIEMRHCSIADIDDTYGKFDYIICHGIISWVPKVIRDKIFDICNTNLVDNGIAYISYNTLPGWNMIKTIRDMMLYHTDGFVNDSDKISQARLLLNFIKDVIHEQDTPYAKLLSQEAELLSKQSDYYLRHDHLEEENKQFYFHEFVDELKNHKLQYLADSLLSSMYIGNMPQKAIEKLSTIKDIVRSEQYMDFITNRRFRSTLICKQNTSLNRTLNPNMLKSFGFVMNITPEKKLSEIDINVSDEAIKFYHNADKRNTITSSSQNFKAVLYSFAEYPNRPISFDNLMKISSAKLKTVSKSTLENDTLGSLMHLLIKGYVQLTTVFDETIKNINLEKPELITIALYQVKNTQNHFVTNQLHQTIAINAFEKFVMQHMDGTNSFEQILDTLVKDAQDGKITLNGKDGDKITDTNVLKDDITKILDALLKRLSSYALFV